MARRSDFMGLREYHRKRDFTKTAEPAGKPVKKKAARALKYVIQKHAATRLHYDFRLELDGVLKSWAVPKGPSLDPSQKHLAVEVEDHPLEYGKFEGTIPKGEYGGGEVIVWDRGTWTPDGDPHQGLASGRLSFTLSGEKLQGAWSLVRIKGREESKPNWLLIKRRDEFVRPGYDITAKRPESVKTQRRIEELKNGAVRSKPAKPQTSRRKGAATVRATGRAVKRKGKSRLKDADGAKPGRMPRDATPQLAVLAAEPPQGDQWVHEIKFDGYRVLAHVERGSVRLITRKKQDWTHRYQIVAERLSELPVENAIVDGEVVALLPSGLTSFQALQNAGKGIGSAQLAFYAFDLLYLDGYDLRACLLEDRKQLLVGILPIGDETLRLSEHFATSGKEFLHQCCRLGLEGIISKRIDRPYVSGRTDDWIKSKCLGVEELVIGGFTMSAKIPQGFGALLMGYFNGAELVYAGRVGTGFSSALLVDLRQQLEALRQDRSPFPNIPRQEVDRTVRWVRPKLVAQVQFTGWTDAGVMRHPSFQGLREDKSATAVTRPASLTLAQTAEPRPMKKTKQNSKVKKAAPKPKPTQLPTSVSVKLTNPDRELYPEISFTKLQLATYYAQVAKWMLPHVVNRPLSLVRCPDGQAGQCFFQKHAAVGTPAALGRIEIQEKKGPGECLYVRNINGLVALAQISALEIHLCGSLRDKVDRPDRMIFDLDPDPQVTWPRVVEAAIRVRDLLAGRNLQSFVKTTGGKGLHVVVPLSPRRRDWDEIKAFSKQIAEDLAAQEPNAYTTNMLKAARNGKIFIDYLRNDAGATAIAPYSTRSKPNATVAMPVEWKDLPAIRSDHFHVGNAVAHVESRKRDPWQEMPEIQQSV
jgi:bifunctional non-homologous end joining protein LigD